GAEDEPEVGRGLDRRARDLRAADDEDADVARALRQLVGRGARLVRDGQAEGAELVEVAGRKGVGDESTHGREESRPRPRRPSPPPRASARATRAARAHAAPGRQAPWGRSPTMRPISSWNARNADSAGQGGASATRRRARSRSPASIAATAAP